MELKQWLYKDGDQCLWNTGGWIKYVISSNIVPKRADYGSTSTPSVSVGVTFNALNISFACNGSASRATGYGGSSDGRYYYWAVGGFNINCNLGTVNPLKIDISKYSHVITSSTNANLSFRTGTPNSSTISVSSATVLSNGASSRPINAGSAHPYVVIGASYNYGGQDSVQGRQPEGVVVSVNYNSTISQIHLI